jgi:hypothetical protein
LGRTQIAKREPVIVNMPERTTNHRAGGGALEASVSQTGFLGDIMASRGSRGKAPWARECVW